MIRSALLRRAILLLLIIAIPSINSGAGAASPTFDRPRNEAERLDAEDRVEVFTEVWNTINERYYDPTLNGVDWSSVRERYRPLIDSARSDEEFYALLKRMVGELHDAHTRFHTPDERREREQEQAVSAGLSIYEIEGRTVVVSVEPDSEAARAGVEPGMIVRSIDGKSVEQRVAEVRDSVGVSSSERAVRHQLYRKIIEGAPDTPLSLGLTRGDATTLDVMITRRVISAAPSVIWRRMPSGYGYIRLSLWKSPIHKQFKDALQRLKDRPGIIIDLRGNPGGEVSEVLKIAGYFYNSRTSFGQFIMRSGKPLTIYAGSKDDQVYGGPVVILINEASGSGSELFAVAMQESGRATVIGRQSCGCLLGISKYRKMEGGGELAVSELGYISPKGRKLEGTGVIPNGTVALTISDLQRNRDAALEEAERQLRSSRALTTRAFSSRRHEGSRRAASLSGDY